LRVDEIEDAVE
jgi:hypothetical protein